MLASKSGFDAFSLTKSVGLASRLDLPVTHKLAAGMTPDNIDVR
jgi:hypothetical protein